MGDINKYFCGDQFNTKYDFRNKQANVNNYIRYMLDKSLAMFRYTGLPDTIPQKELELLLQTNGYVIIAPDKDNKLYAFGGSLGGVGDAYNNPTQATVSNTYLQLYKTFEVDTECVIISNDTTQLGLLPLYEKYCTMLSELDITIIMSAINKRVQMLLSANDDNTVISAKKFIQDIEDGKLGVIAESKLFESLKVNTSATSDKTNLQDLWQMQQYIKATLLNEIGLNSNYNMKKERLSASEVELNSDMLYPFVDDMLMCRRQALEKVNEMFGTDIQVEFNSSWDMRINQGEPINTLEEDITLTGDDEEVREGEELDNEYQSSENWGTVEQPDATEEVEEPTVEPTDEPTVEPTDEPTEETTVDTTVDADAEEQTESEPVEEETEDEEEQ